MTEIALKRGYEPASEDDGLRVLVDRLWLRGLSKERAELDAWMKEVAPSPELRTWFGHRPERWEEFTRRYRSELATPERRPTLAALQAAASGSPLTLIYGAADRERNAAVVLREVLRADRVPVEQLPPVVLAVVRAIADARPDGLASRSAVERFLGGLDRSGAIGATLQSLADEGQLRRQGDLWRPTKPARERGPK